MRRTTTKPATRGVREGAGRAAGFFGVALPSRREGAGSERTDATERASGFRGGGAAAGDFPERSSSETLWIASALQTVQ